MISFLPRKSTVSFALVSVLTYFGSRFNSPKDDRYGPSKWKAAILYPTEHFVSSRTQTFIWQENAKHFYLFVFEMFSFGKSLFLSRLLALFSTIQKKNNIIVFLRRWWLYLSRGLVGKKTTRFRNFFTCFGLVDVR